MIGAEPLLSLVLTNCDNERVEDDTPRLRDVPVSVKHKGGGGDGDTADAFQSGVTTEAETRAVKL